MAATPSPGFLAALQARLSSSRIHTTPVSWFPDATTAPADLLQEEIDVAQVEILLFLASLREPSVRQAHRDSPPIRIPRPAAFVVGCQTLHTSMQSSSIPIEFGTHVAQALEAGEDLDDAMMCAAACVGLLREVSATA